MIKQYNTLSFFWGIPGLVMQIGGQILRISYTVEEKGGQIYTSNLLMDNIGRALMLVGSVVLLIGFAYYAKAKGRSPWWCLFAFLSLIGLIVLACLKDRSHEVIIQTEEKISS